MSEQKSQNEIDLDRVKAAVGSLSEFFDTVHVFVTRHEEGSIGTTNSYWSHGNYFARRGQIEEWLVKEQERSRLEARKSWEE